MRRFLALTAALVLPACADLQTSAGMQDCGAMALQEYVGEPVVEVVSIDTGAPVRVVAPGAPRTATDPDRLSIFTDGNARVVALQCG